MVIRINKAKNDSFYMQRERQEWAVEPEQKFMEETDKLIPDFSLPSFHLSVNRILPPVESLIVESPGRWLQSISLSLSCLPSRAGSMLFFPGGKYLPCSIPGNDTKRCLCWKMFLDCRRSMASTSWNWVIDLSLISGSARPNEKKKGQ